MSFFQVLNRFSFLILPLVAFIAVAALLMRRRARWPLWGGLLAAYLAFVLTSGQATTARYDTPENIRHALATAEQPTLVEFFSNH